MGSLVVIEEDSKKSLYQAYTLVDGQQRLTTISLMLCALRDCLEDANPIRNAIQRYLFNVSAEGDLRFKIVPTVKYDDRRSYCAILDGDTAEGLRSRIGEAYSFFHTNLRTLLGKPKMDPQRLFDCMLGSLFIVFIELDRTDKPYKIFESLNAKGKPLSEADLVRNYIAMQLPPKLQQQVFDSYWSNIEDRLPERRKTANIPELTAFLRHYLAFHSGSLPREDQVYRRFRHRIENDLTANRGEFVREIETLHRFSAYYDKLLRPANEPAEQIQAQLERLNVLESTTAYPLLIYFYDLHDNEAIGEDEFVQVLRVVENYLVRRFLAGEPTNYHNSMFASLARELAITGGQSAANLKSALGQRNYPSDNRLVQRLEWNRIYSAGKSRRIVLILDMLNRHLSAGSGGFDVLDGPGTIEHIMPQSLSDDWKTYLGESWQEIHRELLNTIGNLTIVTQEWNSKLSNSPFSRKRKKLQDHAISLNSKYFACGIHSWDADAIRKRTEHLARLMLEVWPAFAEAPLSEGVKGKTPLTLTVLDNRFVVRSWRGMVLQMVNCLHDMQLLTDLENTLREFEWWITRDPGGLRRYYRQSSAGWWIQVNISAENSVHFCTMLAKFCGLSDDCWSFTYE